MVVSWIHRYDAIQWASIHMPRHQRTPMQDRDTYLDALNTFYRVGLDEGRGRYGPHFCNNPFLTAAHNSHKVRLVVNGSSKVLAKFTYLTLTHHASSLFHSGACTTLTSS